MIVNLKKLGGPDLIVNVWRRGNFSALYQVVLMQSYDALLKSMKPGDIVVDAGANVGMFTLLAAAHVGPSGLVIAVEPVLENFKELKKTSKLTG